MPTAKRKPTPKAKKRNILSYLWIVVIVAGLGWLGYTTFLKPKPKMEPVAIEAPLEQQQVEIQQVQQEAPVVMQKAIPVKGQQKAIQTTSTVKKPIEEAKEISDLVSAILEKLVGLAMAIMGAIMMYFNIKAKQLEIHKEEEEEKAK